MVVPVHIIDWLGTGYHYYCESMTVVWRQTDPLLLCYCTVQVYVDIHFCDSVWSVFLSESESVHVVFIVCLYLHCRWRPNYEEVEG